MKVPLPLGSGAGSQHGRVRDGKGGGDSSQRGSARACPRCFGVRAEETREARWRMRVPPPLVPSSRWLNFRDAALRRALKRGPLFPMGGLMQHGIVWTRSAETAELWASARGDRFEDFRNEVLSFFLSGTGLQELYVQLELMEGRHWDLLAEAFGESPFADKSLGDGVARPRSRSFEIDSRTHAEFAPPGPPPLRRPRSQASSFARAHAELLKDAHPLGGDPQQGEVYGAAALFEEPDEEASRSDLTSDSSAARAFRRP